MRNIILYRTIGASRLKWRFIVDEFDNILHEGPAEALVPNTSEVVADLTWSSKPMTAKNDSANTKQQGTVSKAHMDILTKRGIEFSVEADGRINVIKVPDKEKKISAFLDKNNPACPAEIPSCAAVKEAMLKEIDIAGGDQCPNCELRRIKDKYRDMITPYFSND